ncbi:dTDP-4-dehydrorhamnose 3,5-epimerase [Sutcliffiella horikoshii]|uniref:dTDP-4-dehydrorhamnose 3,5-epimerase n=1 Tax=Sutcliffiella horikoshii TaxID=79883 RepID=UPI001CFD4930|nr:dTDP-4-dehydrorhamnose 3,5-epimerase [Sutcliffiella horikoshii]
MKIIENELMGVLEITPEPKVDFRGYFLRIYDEETFFKNGINNNWVQENHVLTKEKGVIRGFHFQYPPYSESKLIRVISGSIYDVYVDIRKGSKTFGKWSGTYLSCENKKMLLIPKGFAHAYCTLEPNTEVTYKVDSPYNPNSEGGIIWNDPTLNINWPIKNPLLSEKDHKLNTFKFFLSDKKYLDI